MANKKPAKKAVVKKSSAKKAPAKKAPAKKPSAKKPAAKKAPAKKPVAKKAIEKPLFLKSNGRRLKPAKKKISTVKKIPPRIIKKVVVQKPVEPVHVVDTAKAVAFAMSIAKDMKRAAAKADAKSAEVEIKLTRRPTTRAQGKSTEKFPAADLKEFRKRLLEARETAENGAGALRSTGFNESEDHEADGGDGTNQTLRLQALGQMGNLNRTIQQIEEALHRIDDGSYGVCKVCGQLIRKPRLLNQPFVLTCMECQSEMEKNR